MFPFRPFDFLLWAGVIQVVGALIISGYVLAALVSLLPRCNIARARLLTADGVIAGLSVMVCATVLKLIALQTWQQILMLSVILSLRILLKKLFVWERMRLLARLG